MLKPQDSLSEVSLCSVSPSEAGWEVAFDKPGSGKGEGGSSIFLKGEQKLLEQEAFLLVMPPDGERKV